MKNGNINDFMVLSFHLIMNKQERDLKRLGIDDLTVHELHTLTQIRNLNNVKVEPTLKNLSELMRLTEGSLSVLVSRLEKKKYLKKVKSDTDRRKIFLMLTSLSDKVIEKHDLWHRLFLEDVLKNFTEEEEEVLEKMLYNISKTLAKEEIMKSERM